MSYNLRRIDGKWATIPEMFGLVGSRLPLVGLPPRQVNLSGVPTTVWVDEGEVNDVFRRRTHRAKAKCPCGKVVSIGRYDQHLDIHKRGRAA